MLKTELEVAYKKLQKEQEDFKEKVIEGLKEVIDNTCSDSREHIETFCETVGIDYPMQTIRVEIPYGVEIGRIQDEDYDDVDFEEVLD